MPRASAEQNEHVRVLIVEDDSLQALILAAAMAAAGFEVDTASDGLAALWKVREGCYDVVLIDYQIPEIDGYATARLVCDFMGRIARPVLIALTATPESLCARLSSGETAFDAVLAKSSDLSGLFSVIVRCLASMPERSVRQEAISLLLFKAWLDYDRVPCRPGLQRGEFGPARILVIDDDECQQLLLTSVLERRGYVVDLAANGLDAVRKIRDGCYDLALVDYRLPEMDGLAAVKLVHDMMEEAVRPRLIALTATPGLLNDQPGMVPGVFDGVLQKSADLQGLMSLVDRHMRASPNQATRRAAAYADVERMWRE
ncbi:MAG TPA: response regulator [Acetobacteraceae bacterium]|nr:response regulator [Acetobacteraceae bacterium]